jgi:quercetin dioxygenase-like cupin family protein
MTSLERPLTGDALVFDLAEEAARIKESGLVERNGRNARTLLKSGPLRVTMIVLGQGGGIPEHHAEGPITVHVLEGAMEFSTGGRVHALQPGQMITVGPGVHHAVHSDEGATFLLTVSQPPHADKYVSA